MSVSSGTGLPGLSRTKAVKRLCVCVRACMHAVSQMLLRVVNARKFLVDHNSDFNILVDNCRREISRLVSAGPGTV